MLCCCANEQERSHLVRSVQADQRRADIDAERPLQLNNKQPLQQQQKRQIDERVQTEWSKLERERIRNRTDTTRIGRKIAPRSADPTDTETVSSSFASSSSSSSYSSTSAA